jgi:uncharacterized protein (DUF4415 family)
MAQREEDDPGTPGAVNLDSLSNSPYFRPRKQQITLRVDSDVIAWFKANHPRYQTLMNGVLRKEMMEALYEEQRLKTERGKDF